jgi:hypothetical protein
MSATALISLQRREAGSIQFPASNGQLFVFGEQEIRQMTALCLSSTVFKSGESAPTKTAVEWKMMGKETDIDEDWSDWQTFCAPSGAFQSRAVVPQMLTFRFSVFSEKSFNVQLGCLAIDDEEQQQAVNGVFVDGFGKLSESQTAQTVLQIGTRYFSDGNNLAVDDKRRVLYLSPGHLFKVRWLRSHHVKLIGISSTEMLDQRVYLSTSRSQDWPLLRDDELGEKEEKKNDTKPTPLSNSTTTAAERCWLTCDEPDIDLACGVPDKMTDVDGFLSEL